MKLDPEKEQVVLNNKGNTHGHETLVKAEPSLEDYLSKNYSTRAAEQFGKLAVGWRRDIQERRRVQQVLNLSRKIRDTRVALKIGLLEVAERTSLDPDMLLLLESGLLPREELAPIIAKVVQALGLNSEEFSLSQTKETSVAY